MEAIIIPTYNERKNIGLLIDLVFASLPKVTVVVVDDDSPDKTADIVKKKQKKYKGLDLIVRKKNKGRGASVVEGMKYILHKYPHAEYIVEMDSDFSHNPNDIPKLLQQANANTVVIGSRYVKGSTIVDWPLYRIILSRFANSYARFFLGIPINDLTMGFRCYSKKSLASIDLTKIRHKGFITLSELAYQLYKKDFLFKEIPITLVDRTRGKSNANLMEVIKSFFAIIDIRFRS